MTRSYDGAVGGPIRAVRLRGRRSAPAAQRRVVRHQLALAPVLREADHDDAAGLGPDHHALAELGVDHVIAGVEDLAGRVALGLRGRTGSAGPRGDPAGREAGGGALGLIGELGWDLVDEARAHAERVGPERVAAAGGREREGAHRTGDADVREPPLLLYGALVERPAVREHTVLHPDDEH